jgi:hypothetical protein
MASPGIGVETPGWRGARREHTRRYVTDEQRSQPGWTGAEDGEAVSIIALTLELTSEARRHIGQGEGDGAAPVQFD